MKTNDTPQKQPKQTAKPETEASFVEEYVPVELPLFTQMGMLANPRSVLNLQRVIGNAAVQRMALEGSMIQRVPEAPAPNPLPEDAARVGGEETRACSVRYPANCPTYEQWISHFDSLPTFRSRDEESFDVIGESPFEHPGTETPRVEPHHGDRFIDHPTDEWVRNNLPEELRSTAYMLPSDCADIAVILRHVWLYYHGRTERHMGYNIGTGAGASEESRRSSVLHTIRDGVSSGNVAGMLNPYSDAQGRPLRSFVALAPLLHVGDVLVWQHSDARWRRTNGHTQTIMNINREDGTITSIEVLQGNQPLPSSHADRYAPGRRIEVDTLPPGELQDVPVPLPNNPSVTQPIWGWGDADNTILVAAGPASAARRPDPPSRRGRRAARQLSDWHNTISHASLARLQGTVEAALQEMRAMIEGGQAVPESDARAIGQLAGERLWRLARRARDRGDTSHFEPLHQIRAAIQALGGLDIRAEASGNPHAEEVSRMFQVVDEAFNMAARGASTISFDREVGRSMRVLRILVTGFDPFSDSGDTAPRAGDWNPSGAAALALDGSRVAIRRGVIAAVEAVVLPVSFNEFRSGGTEGIVEQIVRPQAGTVDAVITVSMDPNMTTDAPIRLEQFAVGVSGLDTLTPHRMLPAERPRRRGLEATPGHETDPAIVESTADVERIRSDMAGRTGDDVPTPTVGTAITLRFANLTAANQALTALGLPETRSPQVEIADADAVRRIMEHMERDAAHPTRINFSLGSQRFSAEVIEGPGGNFLSNEVSYRTLRVLEEEGSDAMSLHVHTPDAPHVPQPSEAGYTRAGRRRAEAEAEHTRSQVITALRQVIQSVGAQILERTPATTP